MENEHTLKHLQIDHWHFLGKEKRPTKRELKIPKDFSSHTFSGYNSEGQQGGGQVVCDQEWEEWIVPSDD